METVSLIMLAAVILILIVLLILSLRKPPSSADTEKLTEHILILENELKNSQALLRTELAQNTGSGIAQLGQQLRLNQEQSARAQARQIELMFSSQREQLSSISSMLSEQGSSLREMLGSGLTSADKNLNGKLITIETRLGTLEMNIQTTLENIRATVENQLKSIREDNSKQLEQIRGTVDERLQKTLEAKMNESFRLVSERLEQVYKGLGEMQAVARDVGDLKKVLSNVKTRGTLGEVQLGAILSEILAPGQYEENVAVVPKSPNRVEYAVCLPGAEDGGTVYLPIDSKFNADAFTHLQEAYETGDKSLISARKKELTDAVKKCARDISEKYIAPPYTTPFAVMFLPFEGLYAEVVNTRGLVEELQRNFRINAAGPSTMAAMLNSLRMGFRTLAIEKRSGEVWNILGAVKTEFSKFEAALSETQDRIRKAEDSLEKLVGVRTRQITRKLDGIERLDSETAQKLISDQ